MIINPLYEVMLENARTIARHNGLDALNNPHAMIGRTCRCGSCFCCAALEVWTELDELQPVTISKKEYARFAASDKRLDSIRAAKSNLRRVQSRIRNQPDKQNAT